MVTSNSWPESSPERTLFNSHQWSWKLYKYGLGTLFIVNSLWALYILVIGRREILKNVHALAMNLLLLAMGCFRAGLLLGDPYLSPPKTTALFILELVVSGLGSAFSVSAFTILLLILLETTNLSLGPVRFRQLRYPLAVTFLYIVFFVTSDLVVVYNRDAKIMLMVCQVIYVIWGALVSIGFAITAWKIWQNLRPSRTLAYYNNQFNKEVKQMKTLVILLIMASIAGGISFLLKMLTVSRDFGVFGKEHYVGYWSWYGLTFGTLTTELVINVLIYAIALRTRIAPCRTKNRPNRVSFVSHCQPN